MVVMFVVAGTGTHPGTPLPYGQLLALVVRCYMVLPTFVILVDDTVGSFNEIALPASVSGDMGAHIYVDGVYHDTVKGAWTGGGCYPVLDVYGGITGMIVHF